MKKQVVNTAQDAMIEFYPDFKFPTVEEPSGDWGLDFIKRNGMEKKENHSLKKDRSEGANITTIRDWFNNVYTEEEFKKYKPSMIGNLDETMLVSRSKLICVVKRGSRYAICDEDDDTEHVTMLACVTTDGQSMPPYIIFPLKYLPTTLDNQIKNKQVYIGGQKKGWITQESFHEYAKVLITFVDNHRIRHGFPKEEPFLLFVDSHNSREKPETLKLLKDNNITILTYPAHCTHVLQPLDIGIFGPFKKLFKIEKRKISKEKITFLGDQPSDRSKQRVVTVMACIEALHMCCTGRKIEKAFQYSGLFPRDPEQTLRNPRVNQDESIVIPSRKRKRIPIEGKIITNESFIKELEKQKEESQTQERKPTKYVIVFIFIVTNFYYI